MRTKLSENDWEGVRPGGGPHQPTHRSDPNRLKLDVAPFEFCFSMNGDMKKKHPNESIGVVLKKKNAWCPVGADLAQHGLVLLHKVALLPHQLHRAQPFLGWGSGPLPPHSAQTMASDLGSSANRVVFCTIEMLELVLEICVQQTSNNSGQQVQR